MASFNRFAFSAVFSEHKTIIGEEYRNTDERGAFELRSSVRFEVDAPASADSAVMILLSDDDGSVREISMQRRGKRFFADIKMSDLSEDDGALYFYKYRFKTPTGLFEMRKRPIDGTEKIVYARDDYDEAFQLLIYKKREDLPRWFHGGIMYQIFPDRFCRGGKINVRSDAILQEPGDIPTFAERGEPLLNNNFFGGDLLGIEKKLDYLSSLGVNIIYLNPIFTAYSNHRYDTGDYSHVDEALGGDKAFDSLVKAAKERGMHVILDGVFNHTGADSVYFNKHGKYDSIGAYQSKKSKYYEWYNFESYPDKYESWWGIDTLPRVKCDSPSYRKFICGDDGIVRKYIRRGASGWRLDVADELSDDFIAELKSSAEKEKSDAIIIGEVWEDASNKISYGKRRKYFRGKELDSVMNYPIRRAIIEYIRDGNYFGFIKTLREIYGNYPPEVQNLMMNILGTHDTARILTELAGESADGKSKRELSNLRLSKWARFKGIAMLKIAYTALATLPGVPCIYYGDEVGMEGYGDPLCREFFPWGKEDTDLLEYYKRIGQLRLGEPAFADGEISIRYADVDIACYERRGDDGTIVVVLNRSDKRYDFISSGANELISDTDGFNISISPMSAAIFKMDDGENYSILEEM